MRFSRGYGVPNADLINEGFEVKGNSIIINVDDLHMKELLYKFIDTLSYPSFFFLELPLNKEEEIKLRKKDTDPFHSDVYYIDGRTQNELKSILSQSGKLLINDGLCSFGFGSNIKPLEICCTKYNVVYIYTNEIEKYGKILKDMGINQVDKLITAWDTFTQENPGRAEIAIINGKRVDDIIQDYKDWGIYKAETRED
ncbi:MAG: hypothetical protein IJ371_05920 [Clostridia bacterium]|nr:hypothetical protein [Clostridia bacterium]